MEAPRARATGRRERMARKLFVGGLSWNTTDEGLRAAFGRFGTVIEAKVVTDRETGRSRGFGFVAFQNPADSESAMQAMDGAALDMRQIRVSVAEDKPRGPRPDGPPRSADGPRPGGPGRPFNDRSAPDSRSQPPREAPAGDRGFSPRPSGPPAGQGRPPRNFDAGPSYDRGGPPARGFASAPPPAAAPAPAEGRGRRDRDRDRGRDREEDEARAKKRVGRGRRRHEEGDGDLDVDY
ncbi:RNA recognition motif domain-containing protein [Nannocystis pusilla]|uniref:RNA recognition motif domain-containing protein n=1 Tax=Nannocystis pusilla TaxID=889268 RepID=UPI003DA30598